MIALPHWMEEDGKKEIVVGQTPDGKPISMPTTFTPWPEELPAKVIGRIHRILMAKPPEERNVDTFAIVVAQETFTNFAVTSRAYLEEWIARFTRRVVDLGLYP